MRRSVKDIVLSSLALVLLAILMTFTFLPTAYAAAPLTLEATYTNVANGWVRVERYLDTTPGFTQEQYPPDGRGDQDGQRLTFFNNVAEPFSGRFLLYYAHRREFTKVIRHQRVDVRSMEPSPPPHSVPARPLSRAERAHWRLS